MPALGLALAALLAAQDPKGSRGDELVKVELLADRAAIRPGESFTVAVKLTVEAGWHIYWENPGDSGLTTKLRVRGPEGFEIAQARFPTPEREVAEGEIVTYVHKGEVFFLVDVRAPLDFQKTLAGRASVAFDVEAKWLACIEACYPGSGQAHLEIPVAPPGTGASGAPGTTTSGTPLLANEKLFAAARARLPRSWVELESPTVEWSGSGERRGVRISVPGAKELEFFPFPSETMSFEGRTVAKDERSSSLTAEIRLREPSAPGPLSLKGVLLVRTERSESSYLLDSTEPRAGK